MIVMYSSHHVHIQVGSLIYINVAHCCFVYTLHFLFDNNFSIHYSPDYYSQAFVVFSFNLCACESVHTLHARN
jgi:hypothetical protein